MFSDLIKNNFYNIINLFKTSKGDSIIEPLICLIRISILEFKPNGTKISINNNRITYSTPNMLQGALRWSNGDNREDIHNIFYPIKKGCEWFDLENEEISNIFNFCMKGLEKLKFSYTPNSTISHSLTFYKNYINECLVTKKNSHLEEDNTIFLKLKELWTPREITIINNIILELESNRQTGHENYILKQDSLINALESILERKEECVAEILRETTTLLK